jgi:hypothetical protein
MKRVKVRSAGHRALFDTTLPFKARAEKLKTRYTRKTKHRGRNED